MLHEATALRGKPVGATDGEIGTVQDVYFDDERWGVRYLVVDTGGWLTGRKVLLSPTAVHGDAWANGPVRVELTREQVERSPGIDTDRPVSRQYEMAHAAFYGYPPYWSGPYLWGPAALPLASATTAQGIAKPSRAALREAAEAARASADSHLRSAAEVTGYGIAASDGAIGEVADFLIDDGSWAICYLVVDTRKWLPGKQVRITPHLVDRVDWGAREVHLSLTREAVKRSPEYQHQGS